MVRKQAERQRPLGLYPALMYEKVIQNDFDLHVYIRGRVVCVCVIQGTGSGVRCTWYSVLILVLRTLEMMATECWGIGYFWVAKGLAGFFTSGLEKPD